ncbi:MAG: endonuclease domain-containing protein [Armatimonadota bacterium]|nr:endonuclease VII domain-containing protein [bacterium]MDW8319964.1 endonuclease domain-containing protein [Armatimonadota bacterium]
MRRLRGRVPVPKRLKNAIVQQQGEKCFICQIAMPARALQVDHRIPYEISGEVTNPLEHLDCFMLLCGSCNRAKSWSCEHCPNWTEEHLPDVCQKCYWAYPEGYEHIALRQIRRLDIVWSEEEVAVFERLRQKAQQLGERMPEYVKAVLREHALEE